MYSSCGNPYQQLTPNDLVEIQKQSATEEAEEHKPEPTDCTTRDWMEGLGHTETSNEVFEKIVSHQQQAAMTMQEIMSFLACCECIFQEMKIPVSQHTSATD